MQMLSVLTVAFQFVSQTKTCDVMALKVWQYVQALLEFVEHVAALLSRPGFSIDGICNVDTVQLIQTIVESYRSHLGTELLQIREGNTEAIVKGFWDLRDAIVCCAWKPLPELFYANLAALNMLETNLLTLHCFSLERMFNDHGREKDCTKPPAFLKKGYAHLPAGICFTSRGQPISFKYAIGWMVTIADESSCVAAFLFSNWSIVH